MFNLVLHILKINKLKIIFEISLFTSTVATVNGTKVIPQSKEDK